jgi:putative phosphoesterase
MGGQGYWGWRFLSDMKIALIADIHANLRALEAVCTDLEAWRPDCVFVVGDTVNRGPRPLECLRLIQEKQRQSGWLVTRGNHEDYVIYFAHSATLRSGPEFIVNIPSYWTYCQLGQDTRPLEEMPLQISLQGPDGGEMRATHASMVSLRDGVYPETSDEALARLIAPPAPLFLVGHTHRPLIRRLDGTLVVNAGSAGLPFDGDTRTGYARITWQGGNWQAQMIRLEYDRARAEEDYYTSGYMADGGPLIQLVMKEFHLARSMLGYWVDEYRQSVLNGEIEMSESVVAFLQRRGL